MLKQTNYKTLLIRNESDILQVTNKQNIDVQNVIIILNQNRTNYQFISYLKNVLNLTLSNNSLSSIDQIPFYNIQNLQLLNVSNNSLVDFFSFPQLPNLQFLDISNNLFKQNSESSLSYCYPLLKQLNFKNNDQLQTLRLFKQLFIFEQDVTLNSIKVKDQISLTTTFFFKCNLFVKLNLNLSNTIKMNNFLINYCIYEISPGLQFKQIFNKQLQLKEIVNDYQVQLEDYVVDNNTKYFIVICNSLQTGTQVEIFDQQYNKRQLALNQQNQIAYDFKIIEKSDKIIQSTFYPQSKSNTQNTYKNENIYDFQHNNIQQNDNKSKNQSVLNKDHTQQTNILGIQMDNNSQQNYHNAHASQTYQQSPQTNTTSPKNMNQNNISYTNSPTQTNTKYVHYNQVQKHKQPLHQILCFDDTENDNSNMHYQTSKLQLQRNIVQLNKDDTHCKPANVNNNNTHYYEGIKNNNQKQFIHNQEHTNVTKQYRCQQSNLKTNYNNFIEDLIQEMNSQQKNKQQIYTKKQLNQYENEIQQTLKKNTGVSKTNIMKNAQQDTDECYNVIQICKPQCKLTNFNYPQQNNELQYIKIITSPQLNNITQSQYNLTSDQKQFNINQYLNQVNQTTTNVQQHIQLNNDPVMSEEYITDTNKIPDYNDTSSQQKQQRQELDSLISDEQLNFAQQSDQIKKQASTLINNNQISEIVNQKPVVACNPQICNNKSIDQLSISNYDIRNQQIDDLLGKQPYNNTVAFHNNIQRDNSIIPPFNYKIVKQSTNIENDCVLQIKSNVSKNVPKIQPFYYLKYQVRNQQCQNHKIGYYPSKSKIICQLISENMNEITVKYDFTDLFKLIFLHCWFEDQVYYTIQLNESIIKAYDVKLQQTIQLKQYVLQNIKLLTFQSNQQLFQNIDLVIQNKTIYFKHNQQTYSLKAIQCDVMILDEDLIFKTPFIQQQHIQKLEAMDISVCHSLLINQLNKIINMNFQLRGYFDEKYNQQLFKKYKINFNQQYYDKTMCIFGDGQICFVFCDNLDEMKLFVLQHQNICEFSNNYEDMQIRNSLVLNDDVKFSNTKQISRKEYLQQFENIHIKTTEPQINTIMEFMIDIENSLVSHENYVISTYTDQHNNIFQIQVNGINEQIWVSPIAITYDLEITCGQLTRNYGQIRTDEIEIDDEYVCEFVLFDKEYTGTFKIHQKTFLILNCQDKNQKMSFHHKWKLSEIKVNVGFFDNQIVISNGETQVLIFFVEDMDCYLIFNYLNAFVNDPIQLEKK